MSDTKAIQHEATSKNPKGAKAMQGFAATFRPTRTTEEWMRELREGEDEETPHGSF